MMGGSGRNGGAGGRMGIVYNITSYNGEFRSNGGVGRSGENGAAGTVYLSNVQSQPERRLIIYNQGGAGVGVSRGHLQPGRGKGEVSPGVRATSLMGQSEFSR